MSYIGNTAQNQTFVAAIDYFSGNGSTTAFTLSKPVASVAQVQVVVNNVAQNPSTAFTVSSNTITFTGAPTSGSNNIYVYYTSPITQTIAPSAGTVQSNSIASGGPTWDANGNVSTFNGANINAGNTFSMKNRLINGNMTIDQRNAGASLSIPAATAYTVDRWAAYASQASKISVQQNAGGVTPPTGFSNYVGVTVGAAANVTLGAADVFQFYQNLEGYNVADLAWGTVSASPLALSFWVRSSLTGTFSGAAYLSAASFPFQYTINSANTWEFKTISISASTAYTLNSTTSAAGVTLTFDLGAGSNYLGTAGAWTGSVKVKTTGSVSLVTTNSATFYITGVQLEKGSIATPFDFRSIGTELSLCQRYCYVMGRADLYNELGLGVCATTTNAQIAINLPVPMRTTPTAITTSGNFQVSDFFNATAITAFSVPANQNSPNILSVQATVASGLTQFRPIRVESNNSTASYAIISTEL